MFLQKLLLLFVASPSVRMISIVALSDLMCVCMYVSIDQVHESG